MKRTDTLLTLVLATSLFGAVSVYAQNDQVVNNGVINNEVLNVDGYVAPAPATDQELEQIRGELHRQKTAIDVNKKKSKGYQELERTTENLANVTEDYLDDRKRAKSGIDAYNKKIDCMMNGGRDCPVKKDEVKTVQAAPVAPVVVAEAPRDLMMNPIKIMPKIGATTYVTENTTLESTFDISLDAESDIGNHFAFGMTVGYSNLTSRNVDQASGFGFGNFPYQNAYNNQFNNSREYERTNLELGAYGKFYFTNGYRFRPYVGAGVSYNKSSIKFTQNNQFSFSPQANFGNEEISNSYVSGKLIVGTDIVFTKTVGMNLSFGYSKAMGDGFSQSQGVATMNYPDQQRLNELNNNIMQSSALSLGAGLLISF